MCQLVDGEIAKLTEDLVLLYEKDEDGVQPGFRHRAAHDATDDITPADKKRIVEAIFRVGSVVLKDAETRPHAPAAPTGFLTRICSHCEIPQRQLVGFSANQWRKARDGNGRCRDCLATLQNPRPRATRNHQR